MEKFLTQSKTTVVILILLICETGFIMAQSTNDIIGKADSAVYTISWSPDGSLFATSGNNFVILWYADTNTTKSFFVEHGVPVVASKFSQDGKWFLSVGNDSSVIVRSLDGSATPSKINGNKQFLIKDAVFVGENGYSLAVPTDSRNLVIFFRLLASQEFVQRKLMETHSAIFSIDSNPNHSKLLVGMEDGHVSIVDSNTGEVSQEQTRYAGSKLKPRFSPNGKEWVAAADKATLSISSTTRIGSRLIRDTDQFLNAAVFSPDGTHIAAATRSGAVKVYDADSCKFERAFYLVDGKDVVISLEYSPDGNFLLAGTKNGYIYRWSLEGKVFDEKQRKYVEKNTAPEGNNNATVKTIEDLIDALQKGGQNAKSEEISNERSSTELSEKTLKEPSENVEKPEFEKKEQKKLIAPDDSIDITFGFNTLPKYYIGSFNLGCGYRRYDFSPCYLVFDANIGVGPTERGFPYRYTVGEASLNDPVLYSLSTASGAGLCYNFVLSEVLIFTEIKTGFNLRTLYNNELNNYIITKPIYGCYADFLAGIQWQSFRIDVGATYDSNFSFLLKFDIAVSQKVRIKVKSKNEKNNNSNKIKTENSKDKTSVAILAISENEES